MPKKPNVCANQIHHPKRALKSVKIQYLTRRQNIEKEIVCAGKQMSAQTILNLSAGFGSAYNQKEKPVSDDTGSINFSVLMSL